LRPYWLLTYHTAGELEEHRLKEEKLNVEINIYNIFKLTHASS